MGFSGVIITDVEREVGESTIYIIISARLFYTKQNSSF